MKYLSRRATKLVLSITLLITLGCKSQLKATKEIDSKVHYTQDSATTSTINNVITAFDSTNVEYYKIEFYPPLDCISTPIKSITNLSFNSHAKATKSEENRKTSQHKKEKSSAIKENSQAESKNSITSFSWLSILAMPIIIIIALKLFKLWNINKE